MSSKQKKILLINQASIFPVQAMNQVRTNNMIRMLCSNSHVDLATTVKSEGEIYASENAMKNYGGNFYSLGSLKPGNNIFLKRAVQAGEKFFYYLSGLDPEVFQAYFLKKRILNLIKANKYDVVISNYWENTLFFKELKNNIYKVLDPHYAVQENIEVLESRNYPASKKYFEDRRLRKNLKFEKCVVENSDLILPLSKKTYEIFQHSAPRKDSLLVADGNDIEFYSGYPVSPNNRTVLFYGALGSKQNRNAFERFYKKIFPKIKMNLPDVKLLIVGAKPPAEICQLHDGSDIIVTGFVEDVRPWIGKAWLKIIPLELGSGFRGRVVELMAMGIPVIGTHNALDSIGFNNGKEGFISDSNDELANFSINLFGNHRLRNEISKNAKEFAAKNYSLEATFGKLSKFLSERFN